MESFMSDYFITQITASDKRGNRLVDELLTSEGIRRDGNLDYTCGMYDDEMNLIATGSCFGNTLRCMAVSVNLVEAFTYTAAASTSSRNFCALL